MCQIVSNFSVDQIEKWEIATEIPDQDCQPKNHKDSDLTSDHASLSLFPLATPLSCSDLKVILSRTNHMDIAEEFLFLECEGESNTF